MKIGCDVDGVLADFNSGYIDLTINVTGKDLFPARPFDVMIWDYPESYGYTKKEMNTVWDTIKMNGCFWLSLDQYEEAIYFLNALDVEAEVNDIYFITNRVGVQAKRQTEWWIEDRGLDHPTVILSGQKGRCAKALDLDLYIDDKWENALDVARASKITQSFLLDRSWNRQYNAEENGIVRVRDVNELLDYMT